MKKTSELKLNKLEQIINDNYPVQRVSSRSKEHNLCVSIPKNHHPDFYIEDSEIYVEVKGYVRDESMWSFWASMPKAMKAKYKIVLQNPNLASPLANMTYGDWFTAYGIEWTQHPHMKDEWFYSD